LKQFHPKYTSMDTLEKLMEEEDDEDWMSLFNRMDRGWPGLANNLNPERPVTVSHRFVEASGNLNVFERNPYYWKVDQAGNQLPYIDRVEDTYMNREVLTMKIISGELDFVGDPAVFADYTLYKENEDQGNYRVLRWQLAWATDISFMPNQTHIDPVLAEINADRRFRMALSHSVNREKISEIVYNGLATPSQHTVQTPGHLYDEDYVNAYIDYDIQKANDLLDEMGLEWDSQRKYRLRPDGETLTYTIPVVAELGAKMSGIAEIQKQEWERIGLNIELKEMTLDLFSQRIQNQEVDMGLWLGYPGVEISFYTYPRDYVPIQTVWSQWGSEWGRWYSTGGEAGIEPPDHIKQLYDWYEAMKTATDEEERTEYARMILDSQAENLWCVGTVARTPQPLVINEDLTNVPESMIWTWETTYAKIGNPPIWYFDR
jgi:peptide/nickel transport system substrate-binding protein